MSLQLKRIDLPHRIVGRAVHLRRDDVAGERDRVVDNAVNLK
jgi:hypothetical protein